MKKNPIYHLKITLNLQEILMSQFLFVHYQRTQWLDRGNAKDNNLGKKSG